MDIIKALRKATLYTLITMMLLFTAVAASAAPQQKTDINKPTRERVKDNSKQGKDQKSSDKNKKDSKADAGKKDSKTAAAAAATGNKKDSKQAATPKDDKKNATPQKDDKKNAVTPQKDDKKNAAAPKKDDKKDVKPAVAPKKDEKPTTPQVQTLLDNKSGGNKPAQDTTKKDVKPAEQPQRPPVNTETTKFDAIDVSKHQGVINWEELKKNSKIQLVYIKATEGSDYIDPRYKENIRNARQHGFKVGSYHYLTNRSSATSQFRNFIRNVNREEQDLLPVIDVEEIGRWSSQQLRDSLKVFADLLEDYYGCKPVIYTSEKFFIKHLGRSFSGYPLFIAKYNNSQPEIGYKWVLWQFSDRGYFKPVKGNRGLVDLSRFNKGCSINDLIYKPSQHKPKASVMDAVDHKEKPTTLNATEQKPKEDPAKATAKASARQKAEEKKKAAEKEAKEKEQKKKQAREEAKKAKEKAEADKKAKEKAEAEKKAKQKAEQQKRDKERQEAAKKAADEKAQRKAAAKQAREEKAKQQTSTKTSSNKGANVRGALTQSQRNDSIRNAKQSGRKINKSSADND